VPDVFEKVSNAAYVDSMVKKYVAGVVDNVVAFREVSKIARAERAGVDSEKATPTIVKLVKDKKYSVDQAYEDTVQAAYEQRDLLSKLQGITAKLVAYKTVKGLRQEIRGALEQLRAEIDRVLR
jgi:hypothetical protein